MLKNKFALLALCVTVALSNVRAVALAWNDPSLDWTTITAATGSTAKGSATGLSLKTTGFTVCLTMTIDNFTPTASSWPAFLQIGSGSGGLAFCTDSASNVRLTGSVATNGGSDLYAPESMKVTNGTHTVVLSYENGTVKVYWDSQLAMTFDCAKAFTENVDYLGWGSRVLDNGRDSSGTVITQYMDWKVEELKYLAYQVADPTLLLPEPTTLALLALGVAGVALRRRTV